ncbi:MAG: hypothetical protein QXL19_07650 [Ignisphaera sp.]
MSERIPIPLMKALKEGLKQKLDPSSGVTINVDISSSSVTIHIRKWWIKKASQEDLQVLQKLVSLTKGFEYMGTVSKDLNSFMNSPGFNDDDKIMMEVGINLFVKAGILSKLEKDGLKYWYLFGEELDPLEYSDLYRTSDDTLLTLIHRLGLKEIIDRFGFNPPRNGIEKMWYLIKFNYRDIEFFLEYDALHTRKCVSFSEFEPDINTYIMGEFSINSIDDVDKAADYINKVKADVAKIIERIKEWLKKYIDYDRIKFSGVVSISDYNNNSIGIDFIAIKRLPYSKLRIRGKYEQKPQPEPTTMNITISRYITFTPLYHVVDYLDLFMFHEYDENTIFEVGTNDYYVYLTVYNSFTLEERYTLPDISKGLELVLNAWTFFRNKIIEKFYLVIPPNGYDYNSPHKETTMTIDFYRFFGWREDQTDQTVDEEALKIWLIKSMMGKKVASIPLSMLYLEKGKEHYNHVFKKLKEMDIQYIVSLFKEKRLEILKDGIYLDGKKLEGEMMKLPWTRGILEMIYILWQEDIEVSM